MCCLRASHLRLGLGGGGILGMDSTVCISASYVLSDGSHCPISASIITGFHGEATTRRRSWASESDSDSLIMNTHGSCGSLTTSFNKLGCLITASREGIGCVDLCNGSVKAILFFVLSIGFI